MKLLSFALVLLGLAAIASAYQVQRDPCAWGPSYWCKSRTNAQQCRQVQYCRENFWKSPLKMSVSLKAPSCEVCKMVVTYLDTILKDNTTEEEAEDLVKRFCAILGSYEEQCDDLVDQYFDAIWQRLVEGLDPDTVCARLGLCNSTVAVSTPAKTKTSSLKSPLKMSVSLKDTTCDLCKIVVGYLADEVKKNTTEEEAKELVEKICGYLGSYEEQCDDLVKEYFDQIWQLLETTLDPDTVCADLGLCNSTVAVSSPAKTKTSSLKGQKECDDCSKIIEAVGKVVNNSMTEEVAKGLAKQVCDVLGPLAPECKLIIGVFFDDIWKMLSKELTPQEICEQLRLCNKSVSKTLLASGKPSLGLECSACKFLIGEVVKELINTSTAQDRIKSMIEEACDLLPNDSDQSECRAFIDDFFPSLWKLFIDDLMTPDNVCSLLGMCGNKTKAMSRNRFPLPLGRVPVKLSDTTCDICKEAVTALKAFLDKANETEVKNDLEEFCRDLSGDYATECTALVDNYFDLVWDILLQYVDNPEQLCELIDLCNSTAKVAPSTKALPSGAECDVCKLLVSFVNKILSRNSTENEVLSFAEKACAFLPSKYRDECTTLVKYYGPTLYRLLISDIDSDTICSLLGLCSSRVSSSGELCAVCEDALGLVKSLLPDATDTVVAYLTDLCGLMPSSVQDECKNFVQQYGPELIPIIAGLIDPDQDCQMVGLCSKMRVLKMRPSL